MLMKLAVPLMALAALTSPFRISGQTTEPDQTPPTPATISQPTPAADRQVSWKRLTPNVIEDQARIWSFPARLGERRNWVATTVVLGTTASLLALDPIEGGYFRGASTYHGFNNIFTSNATVIGTVVAPVSLYAAGLIRKDSKMQHTALLAGEAVADAEILTTVLKDATKRLRPADFPAHGNLYDSWFDSKGPLLRGGGSFPSGHTIAAFSIATVVARRYGNHRWVPYVAYGMASLVAFSRLTLSSHFTSDVFMGAALGYSISHFAVLQQ
jgi:membrane-associated phospholipid phosphatase